MALAFDTDEAARSRKLLHKKDLADVALVFSKQHADTVKQAVRQHVERTSQPAAVDTRRTKRARTQHAPAAVDPMQWPEGCVVLEVHASQLYRCIHQQLEGGSALYPPLYLPKQLPDGALTRQRVLVVGVEGQEELAAAEPLVQLMYQHDVLSQLQDKPESLLQMLMLANRLQAQACMDACTAILAALQPPSLPLPFMSHLCCVADTQLAASIPQLKAQAAACMEYLRGFKASGQPIPDHLLASLSALATAPRSKFHSGVGLQVLELLQRGSAASETTAQQAEAQAALVMRVFGYAEQVATDSKLLAAFKTLPLPLLRHWAGSEQLYARSENTVLVLLNAWRWGNSRHADAMRDLAACVRLRHLSPSFLHQFLDSLLWFTPKEHLAGVRSLIHSTPATGQAPYPSGIDLPAAWLAPQPRPQPPMHQAAAGQQGAPVTLDVTLAQLQEQVIEVLAADLDTKRARRIAGDQTTINGFKLHLELNLVKAAGSAATEVGLFLVYDGVMSALEVCKPWVHVEYQLNSQRSSTPGVFSMSKRTSRTLTTESGGWGYPDFFKLGPITTTDPLQAYLVDGQLKLQAVITGIDGMVITQ